MTIPVWRLRCSPLRPHLSPTSGVAGPVVSFRVKFGTTGRDWTCPPGFGVPVGPRHHGGAQIGGCTIV